MVHINAIIIQLVVQYSSKKTDHKTNFFVQLKLINNFKIFIGKQSLGISFWLNTNSFIDKRNEKKKIKEKWWRKFNKRKQFLCIPELKIQEYKKFFIISNSREKQIFSP